MSPEDEAPLVGADGPTDPGHARGVRAAADRLADHAAIERLATDLLPALVARLAGTGLGELEVREGDWQVRLRRPAPTAPRPVERAARGVRTAGREVAREGSRVSALVHERPSPEPSESRPGRRPPLVATSPAVGIFRARPEMRPGTSVRAGERLGIVDLLGVPQDVQAPVEAVVAGLFVEDGDAVEYGQALMALEPIGASEAEAVLQPVPVG